MDCAREVKSLGAKEVIVIYRRSEKQMPAEEKEIREAKEEKIKFLFQHNIISIIPNSKKEVEKIELIKTQLIKKEGEIREIPIDIENSNYVMDMDYVIMAVGAKTEKEVIDTLGLDITKKGTIQTDEKYMTSKQGVFAGGDLIGTKATVAWASRSGREASKAIIEYIEKIN